MIDQDTLKKLISEFSAPRDEFDGASYITRRREWFDRPMEKIRPVLTKKGLQNLTTELAERIYDEVSVGGPKLYPRTFIENGVETELNPPAGIESGGLMPVVGTISRLEKDRGIKYFIRAARELINRNVQAHFLVMGTGPEEAKIRKYIRKMDISEHVTLNLSASNYRHLINPIDIFVRFCGKTDHEIELETVPSRLHDLYNILYKPLFCNIFSDNPS